MMCMCGCNQILTACNHVGCTVSAEMLRKLDQHVERNEPEDLTIQSFIQEYGQRVLAQPPSTGFGVVAWMTPAAAALLGLLIIWMVMNQWRRPLQVAGPDSQISQDDLDRVRRQVAQETDE
ncbi:MAG: cytochrome c-type biogenesis protein CcmH [Acidobacteria bacterium]|nr:cytochrome c-type biogenesis protein CcmH [Acidobacteriota bacterium]